MQPWQVQVTLDVATLAKVLEGIDLSRPTHREWCPQPLWTEVAVLRRPFPTPVDRGRGFAATFPNPCGPRWRSCGDPSQPLWTEVAVLRRPFPTPGLRGRGLAATLPNPCGPRWRFCGDLPQPLGSEVAVLRRPTPTPWPQGGAPAKPPTHTPNPATPIQEHPENSQPPAIHTPSTPRSQEIHTARRRGEGRRVPA
jgi:hypothetical protein